jgi:Mrp family chromosome partitioning ATPase
MSAKVDEIVTIAPVRQSKSAGAQVTSAGMSGVRIRVITQFAQEQLRALIRRVFFPGWPKASRQVVVSSIDGQCDSSLFCADLAREMACTLPGTVGAVEADLCSPGMATLLAPPAPHQNSADHIGSLAVTNNLWLVTAENLRCTPSDGCSAVWLRTRLSELRRSFDYSLIHAPAAFLAESLVIGQLTDGIILVVEAHATRRVVARNTLQTLKAAKVTVLGTVLTNRSFPIPQRLYHWL